MSWKGANCCVWDGVQCLRRHVSKLDLEGLVHLSFSGEISSSLFELKHLQYLDLSGIQFKGEIPSQLGGLSSLHHLDLSYCNSLTGHNLQWLSNLSSLEYLSLNHVRVSDKNWGSIIGSLVQLKHLELSGCVFLDEIPSQLGVLQWEIPSQLEGLSSLRHLDLSYSTFLTGLNLSWLSHLSSIEYLSLSYTQVGDKNWGKIIGSLLQLKHLDLSNCNLPDPTIPTTFLNLSSLVFLNLASNSFSNIPPWMVKLITLTHLDLRYNSISGSIPDAIGNLTRLEYLDMSHNALTGEIPLSLDHIGREHGSLSFLSFEYNQLSGPIPPIGKLLALEKLRLNDNKLQGNLPASLANLPSLVDLRLANNWFNGTITEGFFQKLLNLNILYLSHSGLTINISSTWIPTFQLGTLLLKKCGIRGPIPSWISTQFSLGVLDLSSNQLMGDLPSWLWYIEEVDLSNNHLQGSFTPSSGPLIYLDLSMNELSGLLPVDIGKLFSKAAVLILAHNEFEGQIPTSVANLSFLYFLDMSNNSLTGNIPVALGNLTYLEGLHLQNNYLVGEIPKELGSFSVLRSLRIGKNSLEGFLPSSLRNLSSLQTLDVGKNNLTGSIPHWIANFSRLHVLVMRSCKFRGILPPDIGRMPELQLLDLSSNFFAGTIPHSYLSFPAMNSSSADGERLSIFSYGGKFLGGKEIYAQNPSDSIDLTIKGQERPYEYVYSNMIVFDLSNNRLSGSLPPEIDNLKGLMYLNLSMNRFSGPIPQSLGNLLQLESLDLSLNNFSGKIPSQIGNLTYLAHLNLSYNDLQGRIPLEGPQMHTFDERSYMGNPNLWRCPLQRNCSRPVARAPPSPVVGVKEEGEVGFEFILYWGCFGLSMGLGFSAVVVMLVLKLNWSTKCFRVMDRVIEKMDRVLCKLKSK